ncbi:MAG: ABC transporter ATP-binding protein [Chloroflexales bacterium]|nr:ABC transporter ATP-binding protein [Chloroflexales bacterium]
MQQIASSAAAIAKQPKVDTLLQIDNLHAQFNTLDGVVKALRGVSFHVAPGRTLGLVGESGSGKSVTASTILRLLPQRQSEVTAGEIWYRRANGQMVDMTKLAPDGDTIRTIRGNEIAMIFQEPLTSLSPVHTIGRQIAEAIVLHQQVSKPEAKERAIEMLAQVGIPSPQQRFDEYPHQFSGGMRQRAMIAMALSCNPRLLIADEPTTALDVTIQAQILELMQSLQEQYGMAILIITHDLGVIAEMADEVAVMYMGRIVEQADAATVFNHPLHPYTAGLLRSIPQIGRTGKTRLTPIPGNVPNPFAVPEGCTFFPRCPAPKRAACHNEVPLIELEPKHWVRCTLY